MSRELTERQIDVLGFIVETIDRHGSAPTIREIQDRFGYKSPGSVQRYLDALEKKGFIRRREAKARGIELVMEKVRPLFWEAEGGVPLVGQVAAGQPIVAESNIEQILQLDGIFPSEQDLFALRVRGDSMIEADLYPGDVVVVRPQPTANDGDIVAAIVDDAEGTIKRFRREGDRIVLEPANPAYEPIITDEVRIVGVVVGFIRNYRANLHSRVN